MLVRSLILITLITLLAGCGLFAYERLAAYDLTVQVKDSKGYPVSGVVLKTTNNQRVTTGKSGQATLVYTTGGLHVITIQSHFAATQQVKVNVPMVDQNRLTVYLEETRMAEPPRDDEMMREQFVEQ